MTKFDPAAPYVLPGAAELIAIRDPGDMSVRSRAISYRLLDRAILRRRFAAPLAIYSRRPVGEISMTSAATRFATQIDITEAGVDRYCFSTTVAGNMALVRDGREVVGTPGMGLVLPGGPGTRILTGDDNTRLNLWIDAAALHGALERLLGDRLRGRPNDRNLDFRPVIDWERGPGASLRGQIRYLLSELGRPDGITANEVALASFTDLVLTTILTGLPHNHSDRLSSDRNTAIPAYLRRAEAFMRSHAASPIRMREVAAEAGCGERTLSLVFRTFRGTSPLAALRAIRLEQARDALRVSGGDVPTGDIARRLGFTHPGRFSAAYRCRFGETPAETAGRAGAAKGVRGHSRPS